MRRAWCILVLLAATLLLVASAFTDVQAIPLEQYFARAAQEGIDAWEKGIMTHQRSIAQSLAAPTGLAVSESVNPWQKGIMKHQRTNAQGLSAIVSGLPQENTLGSVRECS